MSLAILHIDDSCTGCGACVNICPNRCLHWGTDNEGFFYPKYEDDNCTHCGLCEKTCHVLTPHEQRPISTDRFFLYHSNDESILESSSSGGVFSLFADWVLSQGGVVFGSFYNGENKRLEVSSTEQTSLSSLRKSKYIESFTGNAFSDIRRLLQNGLHVLYCGTPCQIRGLKRYLTITRTNTNLLFTMDFACHGVPSNEYFRQFTQLFENRGKKVIDADFRYKDFRRSNMMWHNMTLRLGFSNGTEVILPRHSEYYYYYEPFLDNLFLRKSCYRCDLALHSDADISLGDFWGINSYRKELDNNKGMSFVSINNENVLSLWRMLSKKGFSESLPFKAIAYQYNDRSEGRIKQMEARAVFIKHIKESGYKRAVIKHYGLMNIVFSVHFNKLKNAVKRVLGIPLS